MEHTGRYYEVLAHQLSEANLFVSAINPKLIKDFDNDSLRKVKSDKAGGGLCKPEQDVELSVVFYCNILQIAYFLIAICHQKCYSICIKMCDNQMEAIEMGQSTISVRLDDTIKKQFDSLCAEFGMSASTAFNIYARTVVRQRKIPFELPDC